MCAGFARGADHAAPTPGADKKGTVPEHKCAAEIEWICVLNLGPDGCRIDVETADDEDEDGEGDGEGEDRVGTDDPPSQIGLTVGVLQ